VLLERCGVEVEWKFCDKRCRKWNRMTVKLQDDEFAESKGTGNAGNAFII
jgi:hypothetical protein